MKEKKHPANETYHSFPIGYVRANENEFSLQILEQYRAGLKQLDQFSHVLVLWWAQEHDNERSRSVLQTEPPYAREKVTGVFACRSEYRPNPVAVSVCSCLEVSEANGTVKVAYIDAWDGTPIIDLKAYFPVSDRVRDVRVPEWITNWPEWLEEAYKLESIFESFDK